MSRVASETARLARIGGEDRQRRGVAASASASSVSRRRYRRGANLRVLREVGEAPEDERAGLVVDGVAQSERLEERGSNLGDGEDGVVVVDVQGDFREEAKRAASRARGPSATSRDTSRSAAELTRTSAPNAVWGADGSDASAEAAPASANVAPRPRDASPPAANEGNDAKGCGAHRVPSRENDEEDQRLRDHTNAERLLGGSTARADSRARRIERTSERPAARMQLCTSRRV